MKTSIVSSQRQRNKTKRNEVKHPIIATNFCYSISKRSRVAPLAVTSQFNETMYNLLIIAIRAVDEYNRLRIETNFFCTQECIMKISLS